MFRLFSFLALFACALLMAAPVAAQDAETFFRQAAQSYIGKDLPAAKQQVDAGLRVAPSDPKLLALREKLKQQEQQQSGQSGQGQPQDQTQEQKGQPGSNQSDEPQDEQSEPSDQEEPDEEGEQPPDHDPQQGEQENQDDPSDGQPGEAQQPPPDPGTLTEAQAERILQALQNQEKQLLRQVQRDRPVRGRPTDKDW